jgi:hypothetical protein
MLIPVKWYGWPLTTSSVPDLPTRPLVGSSTGGADGDGASTGEGCGASLGAGGGAWVGWPAEAEWNGANGVAGAITDFGREEIVGMLAVGP